MVIYFFWVRYGIPEKIQCLEEIHILKGLSFIPLFSPLSRTLLNYHRNDLQRTAEMDIVRIGRLQVDLGQKIKTRETLWQQSTSYLTNQGRKGENYQDLFERQRQMKSGSAMSPAGSVSEEFRREIARPMLVIEVRVCFQQVILQLQMADNHVARGQSYTFSLVRLRPECRMPPVRVDFEPPHSSQTSQLPIVPVFNPDRSFFTPAFMLAADQKHYRENGSFEKSQFEERIQRSHSLMVSLGDQSSSPQLLLPQPTSNYCQLCQIKFTSYPEHIKTSTHISRSLHSEAALMILDLCKSFREQRDGGAAWPKKKGIAKEGRRRDRVQKKSNKREGKQTGELWVELKGQNYSTCILQDSLGGIIG